MGYPLWLAKFSGAFGSVTAANAPANGLRREDDWQTKWWRVPGNKPLLRSSDFSLAGMFRQKAKTAYNAAITAALAYLDPDQQARSDRGKR